MYGQAARCACAVRNLFGEFIDLRGKTVHLDNQQCAATVSQAVRQFVTHHLDGVAVHEFQRAGCNRTGHDVGHGFSRTLHIPVLCAQGALCRLQRGELQRGLGNNAKRTLGTDQQTCQVIAHHTFGRAYAGAQCAAVTGHHAQSQCVVTRGAVLDGARAGGVIGEITAHRTDSRAGRVRWPEESLFGSRLLHLLVGYAGFDHHEPVVPVQFDQPVHAGQ